MKAQLILKFILSNGLGLLAMTCVIMLMTYKLTPYQQLFLLVVLAASVVLFLLINTENAGGRKA